MKLSANDWLRKLRIKDKLNLSSPEKKLVKQLWPARDKNSNVKLRWLVFKLKNRSVKDKPLDRLKLLVNKKSNVCVNKNWLLKSNVKSNKLSFVVSKKLRNSNNCKERLLKKLG